MILEVVVCCGIYSELVIVKQGCCSILLGQGFEMVIIDVRELPLLASVSRRLVQYLYCLLLFSLF